MWKAYCRELLTEHGRSLHSAAPQLAAQRNALKAAIANAVKRPASNEDVAFVAKRPSSDDCVIRKRPASAEHAAIKRPAAHFVELPHAQEGKRAKRTVYTLSRAGSLRRQRPAKTE